MGCFIPGPSQYCWPAKPESWLRGESPHADAVANQPEQPRRRRSTKKSED